MPRTVRKKSETGIYHVMLRGINQQTIFYDNEDCERYLQCLSDCKAISKTIIFSYCLMENHLHLLLKEGEESLDIFFKRIGARFVYWYNWKYKRSGHLFQDRYKSEVINDERYFLAVLRYIFQNPVQADICSLPEEYRWSSYYNFGKNELIDEKELLNYITKEELDEYVHQGTEERYLDISEKRRLADAEANKLMQTLGAVSATELRAYSADKQTEIIKQMNQQKCSIRQIARLTGITKSVIERMLKSR